MKKSVLCGILAALLALCLTFAGCGGGGTPTSSTAGTKGTAAETAAGGETGTPGDETEAGETEGPSDETGKTNSNQPTKNTPNKTNAPIGNKTSAKVTKAPTKAGNQGDVTLSSQEAQQELKKLDQKGGTIRYLSHLQPNGADARLMKSRYKQYCNGNITFVTVPFDDLATKLQQMKMSSDSPDLYGIRNQDFPALMYKDVFQELDPHIDFDSKLWADDKETQDLFLWNGKHLMIGSAGATEYLWYNKRLFEEYGETTPAEWVKQNKWTWDQFIKTATAMNDDAAGIMGFRDQGAGIHYHLLASHHTDIVKFTSNGIESNVKGKDVATALQMYGDFYSKYKFTKLGTGEAIQEFANGKAAMLNGGSWLSQNDPIKTMQAKGDVEFTHIPRLASSGKYTYFGSIGGTAIPVGAKNVKGAVAFLTMYRVMDKAFGQQERQKGYQANNNTKAEIAVMESELKESYPIYSLGISGANKEYWNCLGELRKGTKWATLAEKLEPKVVQAIDDMQK